MSLDPTTGNIYVMSVERGPPAPAGGRGGQAPAIPVSFTILMIGKEIREDSPLGDRTLTSPNPEQPNAFGERIALGDPRALDILTTEHWSLLSTRALGYQEMFARCTIFIAILSGTVVALAQLAQATQFSRETLWVALLLIPVDLFIGIATFVRSVTINLEDARYVAGMNLLRGAYLRIAPDLEPFFITAHTIDAGVRALRHGSRQQLANLGESLTTTSGTVATLNSVLAGAIAGDISALLARSTASSALIGAVVSLVSGASYARYAARFRQRHTPHEVLGRNS